MTAEGAVAGAAGGTRVVVLGTGALACLFGARLARSGARVTLVGTWREGLAAIAARGVRVEEREASWCVPLSTAHLEQTVRVADLVLVLVKSHRTRAIAAQAAAAVAPGGTLLTLQNGLGNREALEAALPCGGVAAGIVTLGATLLAPGVVRAHPGEVMLDAAPARRERLAPIAALLRHGGFEAKWVEPFERAVWRKLAVNCAINPLSALRGVTNGELLDRPADVAILCRAAREVGQVALARGTPLDDDPAALALDVARFTSGNRSSMLQDVARGALTEIDALNGAVAREGRRLGVATPVNDGLSAEIRRLADAQAPASAFPAAASAT